MTPEELDEAVAHEAERRWRASGGNVGLARSLSEVATIAARLRRENWTPPPVDPDVLAVRGVLASLSNLKIDHEWYRDGTFDGLTSFQMALAAYKAGREAEAERAKVLVEYVSAHTQGLNAILGCHDTLAAYKAGRATP
jgi:hypothetical protein